MRRPCRPAMLPSSQQRLHFVHQCPGASQQHRGPQPSLPPAECCSRSAPGRPQHRYQQQEQARRPSRPCDPYRRATTRQLIRRPPGRPFSRPPPPSPPSVAVAASGHRWPSGQDARCATCLRTDVPLCKNNKLPWLCCGCCNGVHRVHRARTIMLHVCAGWPTQHIVHLSK